MELLIAVLITLAVLGSVMWVKPSPRERALTALRAKALSLGLRVRIVDARLAGALFCWLDNFRVYSLYEKKLPVGLKPSSYKPVVIRLSEDPELHELDLDETHAFKDLLAAKGVFEGVPETSEALVISQSGIAFLWKECQSEPKSTEEVERIDVCLTRCIGCADIWLDII
jgi:hypothetical protein